MLLLIALLLFGLQPTQDKQVVAVPDDLKVSAENHLKYLKLRKEKLLRALIDALGKRGIEVEFTGNEVFSTQELLALLATDERALDYLIEGAQSPEQLKVSLRLLRNRLASRGYLQATCGETKIERTVAGHKFIIPIKEGLRYRIGKISFEGANFLSPEQLGAMFPLKQDDVANGDAIYRFLVEHLRKRYFEHGYLQYVAEPEPTYHSAPDIAREGIVDYQITIDEGVRFNVLSVEFVGNRDTPDWVIRPALRLREDEPFRMTLLEESLQNLKGLNLFEEIFLGRDVDYVFNEEHALVTIKIRLQEKNQP